jgi:hypothetical protein
MDNTISKKKQEEEDSRGAYEKMTRGSVAATITTDERQQ